MAFALLKKAIISNPHGLRKNVEIFCNAARNHWNYQYKPGPYPKTPAERAAAATKYGMTIEEYQPYPEDMGYGDYPKLPDIGADSKDPFYPYDIPALRRNFQEPIHAKANLYGEDRYDPNMRPRFSLTHQWTWFLGTLAGSFALFFFLEDYKMGRPITFKQYPWNGPHYEFPNISSGSENTHS